MDLFEAKRKALLEECRLIARQVALEYGQVSIDDVRDRVQLPLGVDGKVFGAVFRGEEWRRVGFTPSRVKSSHSRIVGLYTLA